MSLRRSMAMRLSVPTLTEIFGGMYYDDFDFGDVASLSLTGSAINSCTSLVSARQLVATGVNRPTRVTNVINGKSIARFDGVDDFMQVPSSTALYNFLHNSTGGFVIAVFKTTDVNPNAGMGIVFNINSSASVGSQMAYDDTAVNGRSDALVCQVARGVAGAVTSVQIVNNIVVPQKFNIIANVFDGGNAIASDRLVPYTNHIKQAQNNIQTNAASSANSTFNLHVSRRPVVNDYQMKGDLARLIFIQGVPTDEQIWQAQNRMNYEYGTFPI